MQNNTIITEEIKILCLINGTLMYMKDIWEKYASNTNSDCTIPKEELLVNSIDNDGKIVKKKVVRIHRKIVFKIKEIKLDNGYMIHLTEDQKLLKSDGWTSDVAVEDYICIPKKLYECHEKSTLCVAPSLAYVLGWQISEGCDHSDNNVIIYQDDVELLKKIQKEAQYVGIIYGLKMNTLPVKKRLNHKHDKAHQLGIYSIEYIKFLKQNGLDYGHTARWKSIPDFIMNSARECIRLFLRAYFDAEAYMCLRDGVIEISSASQMIIRQLDVLCRLFEINMRIKMSMKMATNGKRIKRSYWLGYISGLSLRIYQSEIGFNVDYKKRDLEVTCKRKCNTNIDVIPITHIFKKIYDETQLPKRRFINFSYFKQTGKYKLQNATVDTIESTINNLKGVLNDIPFIEKHNLESKKEFIKKSIKDLEQIKDKEVYYIPIKSINDKDINSYIYDFEIEDTNNYVIGGVLLCSQIKKLEEIPILKNKVDTEQNNDDNKIKATNKIVRLRSTNSKILVKGKKNKN